MGRSLRCNWDAFWSAALKDHCHAGLIWNERTRSELREALQVTSLSAMPDACRAAMLIALAGLLACALMGMQLGSRQHRT